MSMPNQLTAAEIQAADIEHNLSDRPSASSKYGIGNLTPAQIKERYDRLPKLVATRLNSLIASMTNGDLASAVTFTIGSEEKSLAEIVSDITDGTMAEYFDVENGYDSLADFVADIISEKILQGDTVPTTTTAGALNQLYLFRGDSSNTVCFYRCTAIDTTVTPNRYTWTALRNYDTVGNYTFYGSLQIKDISSAANAAQFGKVVNMPTTTVPANIKYFCVDIDGVNYKVSLSDAVSYFVYAYAQSLSEASNLEYFYGNYTSGDNVSSAKSSRDAVAQNLHDNCGTHNLAYKTELASDKAELETAIAAKYTKPTLGIPETDLTATAQVAISNANRALYRSELSQAFGVAQLDGNEKLYTKNIPTNVLTTSVKGVASGVAELDSSGHVPSSQLPSYVDDVLEYDDLASFPSEGETGKIYLAKDTNNIYRWTGTQYASISGASGGLTLGETSSTAYRGDRGKTAYDHSQLTSGNPHSVTKSDVGLGNVDNTSDADKPISTAVQTALNAKQASLPTVTNDRYLHTNASTGTLEWSEAPGGDDVSFGSNNDIVVTDGTNTAVEANPTESATTDLTKLKVGSGVYSIPNAGMTNPMTTQGDIIVGGSSGTASRLGIGTAGQALLVNSSANGLEWGSAGGGSTLYRHDIYMRKQINGSVNNWHVYITIFSQSATAYTNSTLWEALPNAYVSASGWHSNTSGSNAIGTSVNGVLAYKSTTNSYYFRAIASDGSLDITGPTTISSEYFDDIVTQIS